MRNITNKYITLLLFLLTSSFISGCTNLEAIIEAQCAFTPLSNFCLLKRQIKVLNTLQEDLDKHENRLNEYEKKYDSYSYQLKAEISPGISSQTVNDLEQHLSHNKIATNLFDRLVVLEANLIPSAKATIFVNRTIILDLEQNIWLLKQSKLQRGIEISHEDADNMDYSIATAKTVSGSNMITVRGENVAEIKEKVLNDIRTSLGD